MTTSSRRLPALIASILLPFAAAAQTAREAPPKPVVAPVVATVIVAEENLAKTYFKLRSPKILGGSNGDADGLLRAVPWRAIGDKGAEAPLVRFSFGAEFKRTSSVAESMIKAGESEPFFVEQRAVQFSLKDCRELLKLLASLEAVKFEKAPATVKYRSVSATYGDFRFRKADDGHVEIFAYAPAAGEIWAAVDVPALKAMISGLVDQMEAFAKAPQTISLK